MKATLEFQLPEERDQFEAASQADNIRGCLWDIMEELRRRLKYEELPEEAHKALASFAETAHEIVMDRGVSLV